MPREGDQRQSGKRRYACPTNKLREDERQAVIATLNSEAFKVLPPSQIVPRLADSGVYVASGPTMYRMMLRQERQLTHRRLERAQQATGFGSHPARSILCWDITYLPTQARGQHFYLYLFGDLFSRKIVGWQVFDGENAESAG